ncbi:TPA: chemotaxis protein CheX [bacterium]|nr:chemotaxis protein CheX [bacterium]
MQNEYRTMLSEVFLDVLMRFAFMFGEKCPKDKMPLENPSFYHARVEFYGDRQGTVGIMASDDLCIEMSANVLGTDIEDKNSVEDAVDTLEELSNVVCGQFLTSAFGNEVIFNLIPPSVSIADSKEWSELLYNDESLAFMVEDSPALLYLKME